MNPEAANIQYRIALNGGKEFIYEIKLDERYTYRATLPDDGSADWTKLDFHQCPHCPLSADQHPHCPLARNIHALTHDWKDTPSYEQVNVEINSPQRTISSNTSLQRALSSVLGLLIGSSECPHTEFFRPMAYFHLPLASHEETFSRALSSYLMLQLIRQRHGQAMDLALDGLKEIYQNMHVVNMNIANRIRSSIKEDASVNAVVLLDLFTSTVSFDFDDQFDELQKLYSSMLNHGVPRD